jgi:hypothetical protein
METIKQTKLAVDRRSLTSCSASDFYDNTDSDCDYCGKQLVIKGDPIEGFIKQYHPTKKGVEHSSEPPSVSMSCLDCNSTTT